MPSSLTVAGTLIRAGFRRQTQYRLAIFAGVLSGVVFGFVRGSVMLGAVDSGGGSVAGYDVDRANAYVWVSQAVLGIITIFAFSVPLTDKIKDGSIVVDYLRPVSVLAQQVLEDFGRAAATFVPRGLPLIAVGFALGMTLPASPWPYLAGTFSLAMSVVASFTTAYCVAALAFWLVDVRGLGVLFIVVGGFLSGMYVPVPFFPGWMAAIAHATPFPTFVQYPTDLYSGVATGADALGLLGVQLAWTTGLLLLGAALTAAGRHTLEVQGG